MEANRDLTQVIVHVDMDAFYASVELLDNPDLAGKVFAVRSAFLTYRNSTHDPQVGHGVLTTASYEARKHGIRSGMPGKPLHMPRSIACSYLLEEYIGRYEYKG